MMNQHPCDTPELIALDQALTRMLSQAECRLATETQPLADCLERIAVEPLQAVFDSPRFDTSMMDGYAFCANSVNAEQPKLPISQRIAAGDQPTPLIAGSAARIFTGAPLPPGADTVVMQEQCEADAQSVTVKAPFKAGQNVMRRGENLRQGDTILTAGVRLHPHLIGIAASQGLDRLSVYKPLKVALINSGDELVMPSQPLQGGQIYNSNYYTLLGLLRGLGCEVISREILADNLQSTIAALDEAAQQADLVMTTGGVSVGDEDHIRPAVSKLGEIDMWRIRIKPGKPFAFGHIGQTPFIGLPGNPVSCLITFCLLARPYILACQGMAPRNPLAIPVEAGFATHKPDTRDTFRAASLEGRRAELVPNQNSASLTGLLGGEGLVHIPAGIQVEEGMMLSFIPFSELLA